jgi:hypothetical protein
MVPIAIVLPQHDHNMTITSDRRSPGAATLSGGLPCGGRLHQGGENHGKAMEMLW